VRNATNTHDCVFIFLAIGYRDSRADRESVTFFAASFRSRTDRTADEATGVVPIKNPGAGRTSEPRDDPQVWREEHEQITIRVDPDLLARLDRAAKALGLSRSAYLVSSAAERMRREEAADGR
jgi:hypothetical protein